MTVSVAYRLVLEHPFPSGLQDCHAAVRLVQEHAETVHGTSDRIAIAGDSAGGNLAAAVSLLASERGSPSIAYQLLLYPHLNYAFDTESYIENAEGYYPTRADMQWFWDQYSKTISTGTIRWPLHGGRATRTSKTCRRLAS